jgi:hypothetical protein
MAATPSTMLRMVPLPRYAWEDNANVLAVSRLCRREPYGDALRDFAGEKML